MGISKAKDLLIELAAEVGKIDNENAKLKAEMSCMSKDPKSGDFPCKNDDCPARWFGDQCTSSMYTRCEERQ